MTSSDFAEPKYVCQSSSKFGYSQERNFPLQFSIDSSRILETESYEDFVNSQESNSQRTLTASHKQTRGSCQLLSESKHHIEDNDDGDDYVVNTKRSKRVCLKMATDFPSENQVGILYAMFVIFCVLHISFILLLVILRY